MGFIAGELLVGDPALQEPVARIDAALGVTHHTFELMTGVLGALLVLAIGKVLLMRQKAE
ncbi:hypothetical protein D3C77_816730 [compost metagenome]